MPESPACSPDDGPCVAAAGSLAAGVFVTFEGGDGAGKTTQIQLAQEWLTERGYEVVVTREPGGTELGRSIRQMLLHGGDVSPRAEALLYAADRAHHIETLVRPALERGAIVLQDRYIDSSVAYQGAGRALAAHEIEEISRWATNHLKPNVTVLLDIDPAVGRQRRDGRGGADRLEREADSFHQRVRDHFLRLAERDADRFLVVEADLPREAIAERVRGRLVQSLPPAGIGQ